MHSVFYVIRRRADWSAVEHSETQQQTGVLDSDAPGDRREPFSLTVMRQETKAAAMVRTWLMLLYAQRGRELLTFLCNCKELLESSCSV